jgi:DNA helicase MCM8
MYLDDSQPYASNPYDEGDLPNFTLVQQNWIRYSMNQDYNPRSDWADLTVRMADAFSHHGIFRDMITYRTNTNAKGYSYYTSLNVPIDVQELCAKARYAEASSQGNTAVNNDSRNSSSSSSSSNNNSGGNSMRIRGDMKRLSSFEKLLVTNSGMAIMCVGLAIDVARAAGRPIPPKAKPVRPRFFNLSQTSEMKQIKANHVNLFVALRGNVVRASTVRPKPTSMSFKCGSCDETFKKYFVEGRYEAPTRCAAGENFNPPCKNRKFIALRNTANTIDFQQIKLQEIGGRGLDAGRIPRTLQIELNGTLCNKCVPGDVVTICGEIKTIRTDELESRRVYEKKSTYLLYMEAHSITMVGGGKRKIRKTPKKSSQENNNNFNHNNSDEEEEEEEEEEENEEDANNNERERANKLDEFTFTEKDIKNIADIVQLRNNNPFEFLVASLCPSIVGNHLVKAGLLLALFGGTTNDGLDEKNSVPIRGDLHVLVVGDPGLGKSQMLKACCACAPRSVYVTGGTTTTTGLTVTTVRDPVSKDFSLEAGALVLGDQGVCCIDEFDKMGSEHQALLEAMEQQSISVAKAGIVCTLPARTSILAAANPVGGHFDPGKTVPENLKMSAPLLSRFDLIYILLDKADVKRDQMLTKHIMNLHSMPNGDRDGDWGNGGVSSSSRSRSRNRDRNRNSRSGRNIGGHMSSASFGGGGSAVLDTHTTKLELRLRKAAKEESHQLLPSRLLRKYIAYARRWVSPKLSTEAAEKIRSFYLELRSKVQEDESTPITMRQLEALVRLAQARAKADMRSLVTLQDAEDVIEIMEDAILNIVSDGLGGMDFTRTTGCSKSKITKKVIGELMRESNRKQGAMFHRKDIETVCRKCGLEGSVRKQFENYYNLLEILNDQNYLLKKGNGMWLLQNSAYNKQGKGSRR